ncbi:hypothetical protein [Streptomyces sp. NPDC055210]
MSETAPESGPLTPGGGGQEGAPSGPPAQSPVLEEKSLQQKEKTLEKKALATGKNSVAPSSLGKTAKATKSPGLIDDRGKKVGVSQTGELFNTWMKQRHIELISSDPTTLDAWRGLFRKVAVAAAQSPKQTYERDDVIMAFYFLLAEADKREEDNRTVHTKLSAKVTADSTLRTEIETVARRIANQLGEDGQGDIQEPKLAIFRGPSLFQADRIYANKSMGGAVANPDRTEVPTEEEAVNQTGFNEKKAKYGLIEEWSLKQQFGFATGSFMMAALVDSRYVRIPPKGRGRTIGEMGVTGYEDLPVQPVVWSAGRASVTPAVQAKIDDIGKPKDITAALGRAIGHRPSGN